VDENSRPRNIHELGKGKCEREKEMKWRWNGRKTNQEKHRMQGNEPRTTRVNKIEKHFYDRFRHVRRDRQNTNNHEDYVEVNIDSQSETTLNSGLFQKKWGSVEGCERTRKHLQCKDPRVEQLIVPGIRLDRIESKIWDENQPRGRRSQLRAPSIFFRARC
jgi:hypothetical protein